MPVRNPLKCQSVSKGCLMNKFGASIFLIFLWGMFLVLCSLDLVVIKIWMSLTKSVPTDMIVSWPKFYLLIPCMFTFLIYSDDLVKLWKK